MLRVLTLSTLFPNRAQPTLGIFVERQTLGLAARQDVELEVVAPIGLPPWPLHQHPHYRARAALPLREDWKGIAVHRPRYLVAPGFGHRWSAGGMAKALLPVLRAIRARFPFDVIDTEFFWPDGPAAMQVAGELGVPFLIKARGSDINYWSARSAIRAQLVEASRHAARLLAVSAALKDTMVALGMPEKRIAVHYTGVDLDRFAPVDRRAAKHKLGIDGPLLVTVAALIENKGQALALEALARIPDATLILAGDGPDRDRLAALAESLGLSGRVRFAGARPQQEVADYLAAADVMVLPTISEGLANAWVEALASGTPVVTTDVGGAREAIPPEAGRLVERDPEIIAAAVRDLLASPPEREIVREAAKKFSWDVNSRALFEHLSAMAGGEVP